MDYRSKVVVAIRGALFPPYGERIEECFFTWGKVLENKGIPVKACVGNTNIEGEYKEEGKFIFSNCTDKPNDIFYKSIYNPCKWLVNDTDYEYIFIADSDTFIHPNRFITTCEKFCNGKFDYVGCACPIEENVLIPIEKQIDYPTHRYASGGGGFFLSRRAAKLIVEGFDNKVWHQFMPLYFGNDWKNNPDTRFNSVLANDDVIVGTILRHYGISVYHSNEFYPESRFIPHTLGINMNGVEHPCISSPDGWFLTTQHYMANQMERILTLIDGNNG